jgi:hypothetical protein
VALAVGRTAPRRGSTHPIPGKTGNTDRIPAKHKLGYHQKVSSIRVTNSPWASLALTGQKTTTKRRLGQLGNLGDFRPRTIVASWSVNCDSSVYIEDGGLN